VKELAGAQEMPEPGTTGEVAPASLFCLIFVQMLPATLVAPAVRPLFASLHDGREGPMHAFMAVNMLGAILAAPLVGARGDRMENPRRLVACLAAIDAALLALLAAPLPVTAILAIRALEGAAHVGAATLLMAEAVAWARRGNRGRTMGFAGGALMLAVGLGSAIGGLLVPLDPRSPFWAGGAVALTAAAAAWTGRDRRAPPQAAPNPGSLPEREGRGALGMLLGDRRLLLPVTAAFAGRFTIGALVVTFSLFAHRVHALSDRSVGLLFSLVTLPFALATYPAGRLTERVPRGILLGAGAGLHGAALVALRGAPPSALPAVMVVMGLASAAIFATTLCYAASFAGPSDRARVMSLVNAAGCAGMLLGPAAAGVTSAVVGRAYGAADGYRAVFALAGASMFLWLGLFGGRLARDARAERANVAPAQRS
jgi:MFS family permease